jgi:hypothetical protein
MRDDARTTVTQESREPPVSPELLARIRAECQEMPGLCLTPAQAARLWGLTPSVCAEVLQALVAQGALTCTRDACYVAAAPERGPRRRAPGAWAQPRGAA